MIVSKEKCFICSKISEFIIDKDATLLREAVCNECGASIRNSDTARVLVSQIMGKKISISEAQNELRDYKILNTSAQGNIHKYLCNLPNYYCGEYFDGVKSGEFFNGIRCLDLCKIPFKDNFFDIIIGEDVAEHIENLYEALYEINRVLKVGGAHIFTVPVHEGKRTKTRKNNREKVYHGDPLRTEGALVYTDFGYDLNEIINKFDMKTEEYKLHTFFEAQNITNIDDEYQDYIKFKDNLINFFKYNSNVYCATKLKNYNKSIISKIIFNFKISGYF